MKDYEDPLTGKDVRMRKKKSGIVEIEDLTTGEIAVIKQDKSGKVKHSKKE